MPISLECDDCGKGYRMPDHMAGKTVPCHECGARIRVPGRRGSAGGRDRRGPRGGRRRSEPEWYQNPLVLAGGGAAAVLLVGGLVWALMGGSDDPPVPAGQQVATSTPDAINPQSSVTQPPQTSSTTFPPVATPARPDAGNPTTPPATSTTNSPVTTNTPTTAPASPNSNRIFPPSSSGGSSVANSPAPNQWDVEVDPLPTPPEYTTKNISVPFARTSQVWFPATPEPLMAIGQLPRVFEIVNLQTLEVQATVNLQDRQVRSFAISPDGKRIAVVGQAPSQDPGAPPLQILDSATGDEITRVELPGPPGRILEFLGDDRILLTASKVTVRDNGAVSYAAGGMWSLPIDGQSEPVQVDSQGMDDRFMRLSPGRRYLATVVPAGEFVVLSTQTGDRVGSAKLPAASNPALTRSVATIIATGFAQDGSEFAAIVRRGTDAQLCNWDVATGKLTVNHSLPANLSINVKGEDLQFLGDDGWLYGSGRTALARSTGEMFFSDKSGGIDNYPRRVLTGDGSVSRVLAVRGDRFRGGQLTTFEIAAPAASGGSSAGGSPAEFSLTDANTSTARRLQADDDNVAWQSSVDPGSIATSASLTEAVPLSRAEVHDYILESNRVVLLEGERPTSRSREPAWAGAPVDRATGSRLAVVTIPAGETQARMDIPPGSGLRHVSPSGDFVLTQRGKTPAVDVWSLRDGSHVVAFEYASEETDLSFARFVDDDRIVIGSTPELDRRVVSLWELDGARQVYSIEMTQRKIQASTTYGLREQQFLPVPLAISPGGRYLVTDLGDRLRVLDLATGNVRGDLKMARNRSQSFFGKSNPAAFRSDGRLLAFVLPADGLTDFLIWDMESGELIFDEPLNFTQYGSTGLVWQGDSHLLLSDSNRHNWRLIDLERHCVVWNFVGYRRIDEIDAAGRYLGTDSVHSREVTRTLLHSDHIPFRDVTAKVREFMPEPLPPVLQPGDVVRLDIGPMSKVPSGFSDSLRTQWSSQFAAKGITVTANAPVTFRSSMELVDSEYAQYEYRSTSFGGRSTERSSFNVDITEERYMLKLEIVDAAGKTQWERTRTATKRAPWMVYYRGDQDASTVVQQKAEDNIASTVKAFFENPSMPRKVYPQPMSGEGYGRYPGFGSTELNSHPANDPNRSDKERDQLVAAAEADERSFLRNSSEYFNSFYGDLLKDGEGAWSNRLRWSPALKRPAVALKWGFAVSFSRDQPEGTFVRIQQVNRDTIATFDTPTAGAGPRLVNKLKSLGASGAFGELPAFRDNRVREPALLGTGNMREIVEAARRAKLDFVAVAYFYRRSAGSRTRTAGLEMMFRFIDVSTGLKLFETERLTDEKIRSSAEDLASNMADEAAKYVEEQLGLKPLPELTVADVRDRIAFLTENGSPNPLAALLELRFYHTRALATESAAVAAATKVLAGGTEAQAIVVGTQAECATAVSTLVERLNTAR